MTRLAFDSATSAKAVIVSIGAAGKHQTRSTPAGKHRQVVSCSRSNASRCAGGAKERWESGARLVTKVCTPFAMARAYFIWMVRPPPRMTSIGGIRFIERIRRGYRQGDEPCRQG